LLILTRRSNERIFIGDDVVLSILAIEGNRVKLGIDAPKEVSILREEIRDTKSHSIELELPEPPDGAEPILLKAAGDK